MSKHHSRRDFVYGIAASALMPAGVAWAKYPFCHMLRLISFAPPEMGAWVDEFQSAVRKQIDWPDGLNVEIGAGGITPPTAAQALASNSVDMLVIHSNWLASLVPDFAVLSDPRVARAATQSRERVAPLLRRLAAAAEEAGVIPLSTVWNFDIFALRSNVAFRRVDDLKGKSFGVRGLQSRALITAAGASAVLIPAEQSLIAVQQGAVEGAIVPVRTLERFRPEELAAIAFDRSFQLSQCYVTLINRQLLRRVDQPAQNAFANAGREAAVIYQTAETEGYSKVLTRLKSVYTVGAPEFAALEGSVASTLDAEYAKLKVSADTQALVRSLFRSL